MNPRTLLQHAAQEGVAGLRLSPGLDEDGIADVERRLQIAVPPDVRELLRFSAGFEYTPFGTVSFAEGVFEGLERTFPKAIYLADDDEGNRWIVDVHSSTGAWGKVFYLCHDPPVVALEASDLGEFVEHVLAVGRSAKGDLLEEARRAAGRVWVDDPYVMSRAEAAGAADPLVSSFAQQVPAGVGISDLRGTPRGSGFAWARSGSSEEVVRCGSELLFAVQPKRESLWSRLLGGAGRPRS